MFWLLLFSGLMAAEDPLFANDDRIEVVLKNGVRFFAYSADEISADWSKEDFLSLRLASGQNMRLATQRVQELNAAKSETVVVPFREASRPKKKSKRKISKIRPSDKHYYISPSSEAMGTESGSINQRMIVTSMSIGIGEKLTAHGFLVPLDGASFFGGGLRYTHSLSDRWSIGGGVFGAFVVGNPLFFGVGSVGYRADRYKLEMDVGIAPLVYDTWAVLGLKGQYELSSRISLMSETQIPTLIDCYEQCSFYGNFLSVNGGRIMFGRPTGGFFDGAWGLDIGGLLYGSWDVDYGVTVETMLPWLGIGWYY